MINLMCVDNVRRIYILINWLGLKGLSLPHTHAIRRDSDRVHGHRLITFCCTLVFVAGNCDCLNCPTYFVGVLNCKN